MPNTVGVSFKTYIVFKKNWREKNAETGWNQRVSSECFKEGVGDQDTKKTYLRLLSASADESQEFNANVSETFTLELFKSGIFTSELFTSQLFTSDSVEVVVEVMVSYAFEVVSSEFAKKEMENNSKLNLMTYNKFLL